MGAITKSRCLPPSRDLQAHNHDGPNLSREATSNNDHCLPPILLISQRIWVRSMKYALLFGLILLTFLGSQGIGWDALLTTLLSRSYRECLTLIPTFSTGPPILISLLASESGCYVTSISAERFFKWMRSQYSGGMLLTMTNNRRKPFALLILLSSLIYSIGGLPNVGWMGNPLQTVIHGEGGTMNGSIVCNKGIWRDRERH